MNEEPGIFVKRDNQGVHIGPSQLVVVPAQLHQVIAARRSPQMPVKYQQLPMTQQVLELVLIADGIGQGK